MSSEFTVLGTAEDESWSLARKLESEWAISRPLDAERNKRDTKESSVSSEMLLTRSIIR